MAVRRQADRAGGRGTRLICWATTDNGEYLYWLVGQGDDPDTRPILVNDESGEHWERYDMTVTRFLVGELGGEVRSQILWDEYSQPVHEFRTAIAMVDQEDRLWACSGGPVDLAEVVPAAQPSGA
ncbi:hypothetical protein [Streptomyces sp. NBC_00063]|uniref:hypothetical protein n=1 Tax=Streptomyces sp. NBC_00063 TaxID=2975638 RepID=UPI003D7279E0